MTEAILASIPSPSQGVWHLGPFPIRAYALCIVAGILAALVIGDRRWVARGGEKGVVYDIALWAVPFGLIGGRLYHVLTDWPTYFGENGAGFVGALRIWDGGLGIWGAVALGGVGAWIGCRFRGIPLPAFGDAIAPGIILAQAIGRLGNYFNQELYGRETDLPWGLIIYDRENAAGQRDMLNGVSTGVPLFEHAVHPTFLYELLWNLLVFGVLLWADRRFRLGHGRLFALYVAGYCLGRFWIELMRSDHASLIAGIRVNTFTSMFVFIAAVVYIMVATKGREDPASLRGKDRDGGDTDSWVDEIPGDEPALSAVASKAAAAAAGAAAVTSSSGDVAVTDEPEPAEAQDEAAEEPADDTADTESEPEAEGLGAVEGDEVAAAQDDAAEVHETAVAAAADAEEAAEELSEDAAEPEPVDTEPEDQDADADEAEPETETAEADAESETSEEPEAAVAESEGLGAVDGDEVAAAQDDAAEVHESAVEAAADAEGAAEELAEDTEAEPETVTGEEPEETPAEDAEDEPEPAPTESDTPPEKPTEGPRKRWWQRRS